MKSRKGESRMIRAGIVGATGLVGREMVSVLQESSLSFSSVRFFASGESSGRSISFRNTSLPVEIIKNSTVEKGTYLLGATSSGVARRWVPRTLEQGAVVIDNSSAYRMEPGVPLVVPEVNPASLQGDHRLIANPNCSTIQLVMALAPLRELAGISWVAVSTYQSVSGAGRAGMEALSLQETQKPSPGFYHRNVVCEIGDPDRSGYTAEELKLVNETAKILGERIAVFPSCARVPVMVGHTESVTVRFDSPVSSEKAMKVMSSFPGLEVSEKGIEPIEAAGGNRTFVGRVRNHPEDRCILQFWVTADNVRKGAALNAVQILDMLVGIQEGKDRPKTSIT